jgi:hypothetical protein
MNPLSLTPSAERDHVARAAMRRRNVLAAMSERQTRAYLIARDAVRRVQRSAPLFDALARPREVGTRAP